VVRGGRLEIMGRTDRQGIRVVIPLLGAPPHGDGKPKRPDFPPGWR